MRKLTTRFTFLRKEINMLGYIVAIIVLNSLVYLKLRHVDTYSNIEIIVIQLIITILFITNIYFRLNIALGITSVIIILAIMLFFIIRKRLITKHIDDSSNVGN